MHPTSASQQGAQPGSSLVERVRAFVWERAVFRRGEHVLLAVSGGADSLSMLQVLSLLAVDLDLWLHVAHVQHGLRGAAADADAAFVRSQAAARQIPCTVITANVLVARTRRESLEAAARRVRYAALRSLAGTLGCDCIATGHTLDDQAETLLLHLMRGAGLDGLAGMRPRKGDLARPLLAVSHADAVAYCGAQGLEPREDLTNYDMRFRRNAVRHDLLPRLRVSNRRVAETLARNATLLADDADYLQAEALAHLAELRRGAPEHALALSVPGYAPLPVALRRRIVRQVVAEVTGTTEGFRAEHIESIDTLLLSGKAGRRWQLPRRLRVEVAGDLAIFAEPSGPTGDAQVALPAILPVPGSCRFGAWQITARRELGEPVAPLEQAGYAQRHAIRCDRRTLSGMLRVRARMPGDRLRLLGLHGSKKVQDLLVDRKVPRQHRDSVPIVCDDQGILWVVGHALDERVAINPGTDDIVVISAFSQSVF